MENFKQKAPWLRLRLTHGTIHSLTNAQDERMWYDPNTMFRGLSVDLIVNAVERSSFATFAIMWLLTYGVEKNSVINAISNFS